VFSHGDVVASGGELEPEAPQLHSGLGSVLWSQAQMSFHNENGSWQISGHSVEASGGSGGYGLAVAATPFPASGRHTAVVRVHAQGSEVGVGVVKSFDDVKRNHESDGKAWIGNGQYGWCLYTDGDCAHNRSWNSGSLRIDRDGGTVAVTFDAGRSSISFETSGGQKRENVYTNLPSVVYLAVSVSKNGGKFELVSSTFGLGGSGSGSQSSGSVPADGQRVDSSNVLVGLRVKRGPDWTYGDQDSGGAGRVLGWIAMDGTKEGDDASTAGWARVQWDSGSKNNYEIGANGNYCLSVVGSSGGRPSVGDTVKLTAGHRDHGDAADGPLDPGM